MAALPCMLDIRIAAGWSLLWIWLDLAGFVELIHEPMRAPLPRPRKTGAGQLDQ
jgi:hypothetical protein